MIPKEDVIVVVTNEGYIKRTSLRSYAASNHDDITLKENDYIVVEKLQVSKMITESSSKSLRKKIIHLINQSNLLYLSLF